MRLQIIMSVLAFCGICVYWWARMVNDLFIVSIIQPLITILCILIALVALRMDIKMRALSYWVAAGLAIALLGDFLNLDMSDPFVVIRGLIIFVVAYLTYAVGFTILNGFHKKDLYVALGALVIYAGLMSYLWPYLGDMKVPGLIYGLILPFLVTRAISTFFGDRFTRKQAILLTVGTSMLYLGDIEFALHTYTQTVSMIFGPFLYAGGQLVVSLSPTFGEQ